MSNHLPTASMLEKEDRERVRNELLEARLSFFDMLHAEPQYLYKYLHPDEKIVGAMRGHLSEGGSAMLVATDRRVLYLDKIPLFAKVEDIPYQAVSGITHEVGRFFSHAVLHTANGDIELHWVSTKAANIFVRMLELICIEHKLEGVTYGARSSPSFKPTY